MGETVADILFRIIPLGAENCTDDSTNDHAHQDQNQDSESRCPAWHDAPDALPSGLLPSALSPLFVDCVHCSGVDLVLARFGGEAAYRLSGQRGGIVA